MVMCEQNEFTVTRRSALLGVLLATLVRPLKALGFDRLAHCNRLGVRYDRFAGNLQAMGGLGSQS